jgi:hypothetical protein
MSFRRAAYAVAAAIAGFFLMIALGALFDAMYWPLFNSWALAHVTFPLVWPAFTIVVFLALVRLEKRCRN